jgi:hypothetical protein
MWIKCSDVQKNEVSIKRIKIFTRARRFNFVFILLFSESFALLFGLMHIFPNRLKPQQNMPNINEVIYNEVTFGLLALIIALIIWLIYYLKYQLMNQDKKVQFIRNKIFSGFDKICSNCQIVYGPYEANCKKCGSKLDSKKDYIWDDDDNKPLVK